MGMDKNTYIGVNIKIGSLNMFTTVENYNGCINNECEKLELENNDKYCSACGQLIGVCEQQIENTVGMYEVLEELGLDEDLYLIPSLYDIEEKYAAVCIPNMYGEGLFIDAEDETILDFNSSFSVSDKIKTFKEEEENSKVLKYLDDNDIEYTVDYSLINYYS